MEANIITISTKCLEKLSPLAILTWSTLAIFSTNFAAGILTRSKLQNFWYTHRSSLNTTSTRYG